MTPNEISAEAKNTDRVLWPQVSPADYYADKIFVTEGGGIGIDVGGHVIVMPLKEWHATARRGLSSGWRYEIVNEQGEVIAATLTHWTAQCACERMRQTCQVIGEWTIRAIHPAPGPMECDCGAASEGKWEDVHAPSCSALTNRNDNDLRRTPPTEREEDDGRKHVRSSVHSGRGDSGDSNSVAGDVAPLPAPAGGEESDGDVLNRLGDDANKWAEEFCSRFPSPLYTQEIVMGWFANAIEHSFDVRTGRRECAEHLLGMATSPDHAMTRADLDKASRDADAAMERLPLKVWIETILEYPASVSDRVIKAALKDALSALERLSAERDEWKKLSRIYNECREHAEEECDKLTARAELCEGFELRHRKQIDVLLGENRIRDIKLTEAKARIATLEGALKKIVERHEFGGEHLQIARAALQEQG